MSPALTKAAMFWVLSTLLNKASLEEYPAKVHKLDSKQKVPQFHSKATCKQNQKEMNLFLKRLNPGRAAISKNLGEHLKGIITTKILL